MHPDITTSKISRTMCTQVIHNYGCGHQIIEKAPCATSKTTECGVLNTKNVDHSGNCDKCDQ